MGTWFLYHDVSDVIHECSELIQGLLDHFGVMQQYFYAMALLQECQE